MDTEYAEFMEDVYGLVAKGLVEVVRDVDTDELRLDVTAAGRRVLEEAGRS